MATFVASNNEAVTALLQEHLAREAQECVVFNLALGEAEENRLVQERPELLLVVLSPDPEPGLALLQEVRARYQGRVLAVGPAEDSKLILQTLRAGADRYLDESDLEGDLHAFFASRKPEVPAPGKTGQVIALLAPSGGSGSSTLAVNVATVLAKWHKSCLLIDLKLGAGDLAALLDLKPPHTLAELCANANRMDRIMFERSLARHESGVQLLSPPRSFTDINQVTAQGVRKALTMARGLFPSIVVDLDDAFHPEQTQTIRQADAILLVLRLDFTSLRNTRRVLDFLEQLHVPRERVQLVVNRYGQPEELPVAKAEQALGVKIAHYVPDDPKTINRANNNGIPAVLEAPGTKFSKSISQLVTSVNGQINPR